MLQCGSQDTETITHCLLKSTFDYWGPITLLQWVRGGFESYTQKKVHPDIAHCQNAGPLISYFFLKGRGRGRGNSVNLIPEVCKGRRQDSFWLQEIFHTIPNQSFFQSSTPFFKHILGFCASFLPPLKFFHWSFWGFCHTLFQLSSSSDQIKINYLQYPNHSCSLRTREEQSLSFFLHCRWFTTSHKWAEPVPYPARQGALQQWQQKVAKNDLA